MRDPYDILGVPAQASADQIHAAYRRLAKRYHPDMNPGDPTAEARFKQIAEAYAVLSHTARRAAFDNERAAAGPWDGFGTASAESRASYAYSDEVGYPSRRRDDLDSYIRGLHEKRTPAIRGWPLAIALWVLLTFGYSMLRGAETELDGVIVAADYAPVSIAHYLLVRWPAGPARARQYTILRPDGREETFVAGQACSLLYEWRRTGSVIHKQAWRLSYEINGREVSDISTASTSCVMHVPIMLFFVVILGMVAVRPRRYT